MIFVLASVTENNYFRRQADARRSARRRRWRGFSAQLSNLRGPDFCYSREVRATERALWWLTAVKSGGQLRRSFTLCWVS